jgi:hypothetical protein
MIDEMITPISGDVVRSAAAPSGASGSFGARRSRHGSSVGMAGLPMEAAAKMWSRNAWHHNTTPGAYETWTFHGVDSRGDGVVVRLFDGLPVHPGYLSAYTRYAWRHTRRSNEAAPDRSVNASANAVTARGYPAAYVCVYQGFKPISRFLNVYPAGSFEQNAEGTELRVGPNRLTLRSDGSIGLAVKGYPFDFLRGQARQRKDQTLSATLTFNPTFPGVQHVRTFRPPEPNGLSHTWILAAPHGRMTGRVQQLGSDQLSLLDMQIDSLGFHDHHVGAAPISHGVKHLLWGHAMNDDIAVAWNYAGDWRQREGAPHAAGVVVFQKDQPPIVIDEPLVQLDRRRFTRYLMQYPQQLTLHGCDARGHSLEVIVRQTDPQDGALFFSQFGAQVDLTIAGRPTLQLRGATQTVNTRSLKYPVISDLVLRTMLRIDQTDPLWRQ